MNSNETMDIKVTSDTQRWPTETYCFAPLFNFNTKAREIKLTDGCVIGPPTDEEKQVIRDQAHNFAIRLWPRWKFVGRTGLHVLTKDESGDSDWGGEIYGMHRAMTVFKSGRIGLGPKYRVQTVPCECIGIATPNPVGPNPNREVYTLSRREGLLFSAFYDKFRLFDFNKHQELSLAILRLTFSQEQGLLYQPIDLMIGFEALYLGDEQELAYKLATRASYLLGRTSEHRRYAYRLLKKAYVMRSKLVHGEIIPARVETAEGKLVVPLYEFFNEVANLLRESIKRFMELEAKYSHEQLIATLLDDNVLAAGTLLR